MSDEKKMPSFEEFQKVTIEDGKKVLEFNKGKSKKRSREIGQEVSVHLHTIGMLMHATVDACVKINEDVAYAQGAVTLLAHFENLGLITINK